MTLFAGVQNFNVLQLRAGSVDEVCLKVCMFVCLIKEVQKNRGSTL